MGELQRDVVAGAGREDSLNLGPGELDPRPGEILSGVHQSHVLQYPIEDSVVVAVMLD